MGKQRLFWFDQLQEKRHIFISNKDIDRFDDKREARAEGGRRFQRERPATEKDSDLTMSEGRRDKAQLGSLMASRRYLDVTHIWALRTIRRTLYSMRLEIESQ